MTIPEIVERQAAFITEAHQRIRAVNSHQSFSLASLWLTGHAVYRELDESHVNDLLSDLERKRIELLTASGAGAP